MLLGVATTNVNEADKDHSTPLHMAATQGNKNIVELLVCAIFLHIIVTGVTMCLVC